MAVETVSWRRRHFPFNAAQTVNILGEIGPLFAMFLVNGVYGIAAGTWALIFSTILSLIVTLWMLGRPPIMPFIAGAVSITFGTLTLVTGDAMWVQIKVTLFNSLVALLLWIGMRTGKNFFRFVFGYLDPLQDLRGDAGHGAVLLVAGAAAAEIPPAGADRDDRPAQRHGALVS